MTGDAAGQGPLAGLRVLDLSRVLAGPWCSQVLGDLGADVIKVERPGHGDDTRKWGPPFLEDGSHDSAYFLCANRNKRSIAIDLADERGAKIVRTLALRADVVVENFLDGGLAKYGLDYETIRAMKPDIVWCSITGFGHEGPLRDTRGYDFLIQAMSGLMSVTGHPDDRPGGGPVKVGTPTCDLSTGLYAAIAILAALRHRDVTGEGQMIDCALLDTQVALLANQASNWMNGGKVPRRMGNQHPNMAPYEDFACADSTIIVATGNNRQFESLCDLLGLSEVARDERFAQTSDRAVNREALLEALRPAIGQWQADELITALRTADVPVGRVNEVPDVLRHPQIEARGLVREIRRDDDTPVKFLGFPAKLGRTPATYRRAPPRCGGDTGAVLHEELGLTDAEIEDLLAEGIVAACR